MNLSPRQIRLMVKKGELDPGEFAAAFYVKSDPVPWRIQFDRRNREFNVVVRGQVIAAIGGGFWHNSDIDAMPHGRGIGVIQNFYPLDYRIEWDSCDQLSVLEYVSEG